MTPQTIGRFIFTSIKLVKPRSKRHSDPERSEGEESHHEEILRFAQDDVINQPLFFRLATFVATFLLFIIFCSATYASPEYPDSYFDGLKSNIQSRLKKGRKRKADFWIGRYLGVCAVQPESGHSVSDLKEELKKRDLDTTVFLSKKYDSEFIDWF